MNDQALTSTALAVAVAARTPVLLWGAPGTGKTSFIRALAERLEWHCETVIASIREPSDFAGLPVVVQGGVRLAPPMWAERLAAQGRGLLFLDEISTAPPAVQAALLRVVLERVVGDVVLPDDVVVVSAANPPEQAADGWDLAPPLANRFCHLDWPVDALRFADGILSGFPVPDAAQLPPGWDSDLPTALSLVSAFVRARPALLCAPPADASSAGRAWPSPRTWEMAARLWTAATVAGAGDEARSLLVRGAVGDAAGLEFCAWAEAMDLPDPEAVLADPDGFLLPERGDRAYAALSAIAAAVASRPTPERWAAAWRVLGRAGEAAPDVAATAARTLAGCRPEGAAVPPEVRTFLPILRDAGLMT